MSKNATNAEQPTATLAGEATNGEKAVFQQPTENKKSPVEQFEELLKQHPELAKQLSQPEKPQVELPPSFFISPKAPAKESRIFLLHGDHYKRKGDVIMDMTDDILDPVTKKTRRMRLIRGAQSIWQDEQGNLPKEHTEKPANKVSLIFSRGRCIIPIHETLKIQAAEVSNRNMDNPHKVGHKDIYFYEWNPEKETLKEEARQNLIIQAMQIAATAEYVDILPHAQYLGVQVNDEMGIPFSESAVRTLYSKKAMNEPEKFLNSIHSPVVKTAHLVRRALSEGKIDLGRQANQAFWTDGGFITALPQGRDGVEYLVEFASTQGEANDRFLKQLKEILVT